VKTVESTAWTGVTVMDFNMVVKSNAWIKSEKFCRYDTITTYIGRRVNRNHPPMSVVFVGFFAAIYEHIRSAGIIHATANTNLEVSRDYGL